MKRKKKLFFTSYIFYIPQKLTFADRKKSLKEENEGHRSAQNNKSQNSSFVPDGLKPNKILL